MQVSIGAPFEMGVKEFTDINVSRCTSRDGFNMPNDPEYMVLCMAQELGEISAILTKLKRGYNKREQKKFFKKFKADFEKINPDQVFPYSEGEATLLEAMWEKSLLDKVGSEFADLFTYVTMASRAMGVKDLMWESMKKFNQVSLEMGIDFKIGFKLPEGTVHSYEGQEFRDGAHFPGVRAMDFHTQNADEQYKNDKK